MRPFLHKILLIISLIFAAALLISYLAKYISPDIFWPPAFFALSYPYLLVLNAALAIYWIFRLRISFIIPLSAILIGYSHLSKFIQIGNENPQEYNQDQMKILSYNIRSFDRYQWTKDPNTPKQIISLIAEKEPGIVCLQEFRSTPRGILSINNLKKKFKTHYAHISKRSNGVATFSQYPIIKRGEIPFSPKHLCSCIFTDLKIGKDTVRIYNVHLESNRFIPRNYKFIKQKSTDPNEKNLEEIKDISIRLRYAFAKRAQQADIIHKHSVKSPHPAIICGDFNDTPNSYAYNKIRNNFKDAFQEYGKGVGTTYNGDFPSFRIDFLLYNPEINCTGYFRIKEKHSDHYPIYGTFSTSHH